MDIDNTTFVVDHYGEGGWVGVGEVWVLVQKSLDPTFASK
jgi:hypothetical protein